MGYYFILLDMVYQCVVQQLDDHVYTNKIKDSIKIYMKRGDFAIDLVSNLYLFSIIFEGAHYHFNGWQPWVFLIHSKLEEDPHFFDNHIDTKEFIKSSDIYKEQQSHQIKYLIFFKFL
jgi:hypothetical protein